LDVAVLDRYLAGQASGAEQAQIDAWLDGVGRHEIVEALRGVSDGASLATRDPDVERAVARLVARIDVAEPSAATIRTATLAQPNMPRSTSHRPLPWLGRSHRWMAALGAAAAAVVLFASVKRSDTSIVHQHLRTYRTTVAQQATVVLDDGSRITLAPQTTLTIAADFDKTTRSVTLDGEAYFDVSSTHHNPFIVRAGAVRTQVLGTAFDVRHYASERDVRVTVVSGRVSVSRAQMTRGARPGSSFVLAAGMMGRVMDSTVLVTEGVDASMYSAWKTGKLVFRDTPLPDVLAAVGRWYGYEFHLADSTLARQQITVTFGRQSPASVLAVLKTMLDASMTFSGNGRVVTLHTKQSNTPDTLRHRGDRNTLWSQPKEVGR